jgi:hypothetical protein
MSVTHQVGVAFQQKSAPLWQLISTVYLPSTTDRERTRSIHIIYAHMHGYQIYRQLSRSSSTM